MAKFTSEQIESALNAKSERLGPSDIKRIAGARDAVLKMLDEFPDGYAQAKKQGALLFDLIAASSNGKIDVRPEDLKHAAGALIYLGEALDIVPDDQEDGYADDAAIIALAIQKSAVPVRALCLSKGLDPADYLD
jgi:uncharacterized membrane protein YkvA (DUF1232 family)